MKKMLAISLIFFAFLSTALHWKQDLKSFRYIVYSELIPEKIDPFNNQVNSNQYIMSQLYYPLLEAESTVDGDLQSRFIDTTNLYERAHPNLITFCLKPGIRFSDESAITVQDLEYSLSNIRNAQPENFKFHFESANNDCVELKISESPRTFLNKFTSVSTTIVKSTESPFPTGLGPYRFESRSASELTLVKSPKSNAQVERVIFRSIDRLGQNSKYEERDVYDLNHVFTVNKIEPRMNTKEINWSIKKTYVLGIFHKDFAVRENLISCLRGETLTQLVSTKTGKIPGFLPKGMIGWNVDFDETLKVDPGVACASLSNQSIDLYVYTPEMLNKFLEFSEDIYKKTGFRFRIKVKSLKETIEAGFSGREFSSIIGFDTSGSVNSTHLESAVFFESFYRKPWLGSQPIKGLEELVSRAAAESYGQRKTEQYRKAHKLFLEARYVLPIGEAINTQKYDCRLKEIKFQDDISGTLKIEDARIEDGCG